VLEEFHEYDIELSVLVERSDFLDEPVRECALQLVGEDDAPALVRARLFPQIGWQRVERRGMA
jgi:hypothetical protein